MTSDEEVETTPFWRGVMTGPDGSRRYMIDHLNAADERVTLLDIEVVERSLPATATEADWRAAAEDLKALLRDIWPAVRADLYNGWDPHMTEVLSTAPQIRPGALAILADIAGHIAFMWIDSRDTSNWETIDAAIDEAVPWAPLASDRWDTYRIGTLLKAGLLEPDAAALEDLRAKERSGEDGDDNPEPESGFSEILVAFDSEADGDARVRAARELRLPVEVVVWAHHGTWFGEPLVVDDQVWATGQDALLAFDACTGAPVVVDDTPQCSRLHGMWDVEGLILADHLGSITALDRRSRAAIWEMPASAGMRADGTRVMIRDGGHLVRDPTSITCVELTTGAVQWRADGTGDRPGLSPVGFAGGLAWIVRRDGSSYHLEALDEFGTKVHEWDSFGSSGEVIGDRVVLGGSHATWQELLEHPEPWVDDATPVVKIGDVTVWRQPRGWEEVMIGAGTSEGPDWLALAPIPLGRSYDGPNPPWTQCDGRLWYGDLQGSLFGIGRGTDDFVHVQLPGYLRGEVTATRDDHLVISAAGASGGQWLACLNMAALIRGA